jgi:predicted nuclease of predicted toxin-antitoxin system
MKLLVDMNLSPRWVTLLTGAGIVAEHWSTLGVQTAPERAVKRAQSGLYLLGPKLGLC